MENMNLSHEANERTPIESFFGGGGWSAPSIILSPLAVLNSPPCPTHLSLSSLALSCYLIHLELISSPR
ncbi:hypothetical protein ECG_04913 [Echinococcus granulosus]|uniref:Uncharacterized protein n=1 Tax=Echinococcus granulosus TaxID=6210 RepID=A0A068WGI4_ECHGR|nr:hypothetical protein ECG_04913 [Echinococcus granulosus]CDS16744.1 hypothetical protein EgrG_000944900 [Echinococcus granulosus]